MFKKILIANRGEIAVRIMNTCREMGIETVAVFSEADKNSLHRLTADYSVSIGSSEPAASYLNINVILDAAEESGAEAIHPGYGFLAENPQFAEECAKRGITFIGPPPNVIRDLGNKVVARKIMLDGGVPVVPGRTWDDPDPDQMRREAEKIGYPVMIKAAAGGGGKGIRIVHSPAEMKDAAVSAASEAESAFGDGLVFLEKYVEKSRHVEFQILADSHGNVIHLLERECSIQRRHQKIIEETPSTVLDDSLRKKMGEAAVRAAQAAGYVNAGTVEFLLADDGSFYFLEVNTRLQVEHPITEMVTGIDLVRHQIKVAAGEKLSLTQDDIQGRGHAIECRIYAEDPENGFFPSPGTILCINEPSGPGIRNDCGVYSGVTVPVEYDPIISKLIAHGESREEAIVRMLRALRNYAILGVKTPIPFLIDVLKSVPFQKGETYTDFIPQNFAEWSPANADEVPACIAYIVDEMAGGSRQKSGTVIANSMPTPWETLGSWED